MEQLNNTTNNSSVNNTELPKNNSNTPFHSKNLIFIVLGLTITIVLVLIVLSLISSKKSTQQNQTTSLPTAVNSTSSIESNRSEFVAFKEGSTFKGDLWISSIDGIRKKLTSSGNIVGVFNWSTDNKYILVSFTDDPKTPSLHFAAVEVQTGKIIVVPGDVQRWINNNEIVYIERDKVNKITISGDIQELGELPKDILDRNSSYRLNGDATKLSYDTSEFEGPVETSNIFIYDLGRRQRIQITKNGGVLNVGWIEDKIVYEGYYPSNRLWISDSNGQDQRAIVSLDQEEEFIGSPFIDKGMVIYTTKNSKNGSEKIFMYNLKKNKISELMGKSVIYPSLSGSLKYLAYKDGVYPNLISQIVDRETGNIIQICKNDCSDFTWNN